LISIPPFQSGFQKNNQIFEELIDMIDEKCSSHSDVHLDLKKKAYRQQERESFPS
jgi:hypothetical protein